MDAARLKTLLAEHHIGRRHVLYLRTKNPIHAWSAYKIARALDAPVPAWVLAVFDQWAVTFTSTHTSAKKIADALGIGKAGGETVTKKAARELRDLEIVVDILHLKGRPTRAKQEATLKDYRQRFGVTGVVVDPGDRNITEIMEQVAEKYDLDYNTVKTIYYKMRGKHRTTPSGGVSKELAK